MKDEYKQESQGTKTLYIISKMHFFIG